LSTNGEVAPEGSGGTQNSAKYKGIFVTVAVLAGLGTLQFGAKALTGAWAHSYAVFPFSRGQVYHEFQLHSRLDKAFKEVGWANSLEGKTELVAAFNELKNKSSLFAIEVGDLKPETLQFKKSKTGTFLEFDLGNERIRFRPYSDHTGIAQASDLWASFTKRRLGTFSKAEIPPPLKEEGKDPLPQEPKDTDFRPVAPDEDITKAKVEGAGEPKGKWGPIVGTAIFASITALSAYIASTYNLADANQHATATREFNDALTKLGTQANNTLNTISDLQGRIDKLVTQGQ